MKTKTKLQFAVLLILLVLASGCIGSKKEYEPKATLTLSTQEIVMDNGTTSRIIDATVEKRDDEEVSTAFVVKFEDFDNEYIQIRDAETNQQITSYLTSRLTEKGRKHIKQFKIYGEKVPLQSESPWTVTVELSYNNTPIDKETKTISITVK